VHKPISVAAPSNGWVCSRSLPGTAGSNPTGDMDVCLLSVLCVIKYRSLRRADHSSRGVLPSATCLSVIVKPRQWRDCSPLGADMPWKKKMLRAHETWGLFPDIVIWRKWDWCKNIKNIGSGRACLALSGHSSRKTWAPEVYGSNPCHVRMFI